MTRRTGLYSKKFQPTAAQTKFIAAVQSRDWVTASFVGEATRAACRRAGWVTDSTIRPTITRLGIDALRQMQEGVAA